MKKLPSMFRVVGKYTLEHLAVEVELVLVRLTEVLIEVPAVVAAAVEQVSLPEMVEEVE